MNNVAMFILFTSIIIIISWVLDKVYEKNLQKYYRIVKVKVGATECYEIHLFKGKKFLKKVTTKIGSKEIPIRRYKLSEIRQELVDYMKSRNEKG